MSVSIARSQYRKTESAAAPEVDSPHKVILVTLTELDRSLAVLVAAQDQERALPDDHMNRCFTALYILQSSLDFENGGDLAGSLFQIYEYARLQVLKAFRKELDADLEQAKLAIDGIRSAWAEIEDQVSDIHPDMTVETHQQIKRMDTLLLGIKEAAVAGDLDRIARLEHAIKHISLEMFASIDVTVEQPNGVLNAIEEAVSTLREVLRVLSRRRAAMGEKLKQDRQIRLVYSRGAPHDAV